MVFFLYLLSGTQVTFGGLSENFLKKCLSSSNNARTVIVNFDQYKSPYIKDYEHTLRGLSEQNIFKITGANQKCSINFKAELKNIIFKQELVTFFIKDWQQNSYILWLSNKTIFINYVGCYKFEVINEKVCRSQAENFSCPDHIEADTKIINNIFQIDVEANVVIRYSDTDILVVLLGNMCFLKENLKVWIKAGTGNNQTNIDVNKLYEHHGEKICNALPAFHALTGCDYNPALYNKGKKHPFKILKESEEFLEACDQMSDLNTCTVDEVFKTMEKFVCHIYSNKRNDDVDKLRSLLFHKTYQVNDDSTLLKLQKKHLEGSSLPPCKNQSFINI